MNLTHEEIDRRIFGDVDSGRWADERPWRVEHYTKPPTKTCRHLVKASRIITAQVLWLIVDIVNEAK